MSHGVSIAHARRLSKKSPSKCVTTTRIDEDGKLQASLAVDVKEAGLKAGKGQDVRAVLYKPNGSDEPTPLTTPDGKHAIAVPLTVRPRKGQDVFRLQFGIRLTEHAGEDVLVIVERVPSRWVPVAIVASLVALALAAAWLLGAWSDPSARKGHYEGKTPEEIQADLDEDVAWHSMEISVASRITVPEGQTRIEARIENVEANHCDQKVRIWESGHEDDVLFESGAIAPGEYLQYVDLAHELPAGEHVLTVQFQGYEQNPVLVSNEGVPLGHDTFGASCAAEVVLEVIPA